jgi:hypothetical protein
MAGAVTLMLSGSPASSSATNFGPYGGPIISWLARAPASCALSNLREFNESADYRHGDHVAYWVGKAMSNDTEQFQSWETSVPKPGAPPGEWSGMADMVERVNAVYDRHRSLALFTIGHTDMSVKGIFADQPAPPAGAPEMGMNLSGYRLAGNVHPGDSLAAVQRSLGLHKLAPMPLASCPGLSVVETCGWNAKGCACPHTFDVWMKLADAGDSGTIVFRNARVSALIWDSKCFPAG